MRYTSLLALVALAPACFNPSDADTGLGDDTETGGDTDPSTSGLPTDTSPTDSSSTDPSTSSTSGDPTTDTTTGEAFCGDGDVNGDEVCDDGVNDGAYGGCLEDCSGPSQFCGDGDLNGPEACDDGTNDGAYGGCNADCSVGPNCGDGDINGPELCDNGEENANGSGCNVDCITSATILGEYMQDGLAFCDGAFTTAPQFNAAGNALVSASGYCGGDTQLLMELTVDVEEMQTFDVLLPDTPMRTATTVGENWVLAAGGCNYIIDGEGSYSEICQAGRITGYSGLDGIDDENYFVLGSQEIAWYGPGSPAIDDAPVWTQIPPDNSIYDYSFWSIVEGPNGSAIVGGTRTTISSSLSVGYFSQFTAAGNLVDTNTYAGIETIHQMASGPDGSLLLYWRAPFSHAIYPDGLLTKLNAAFGEDWTIQIADPGDIQMAIDSAGDVVLLHEDGNGNGSYNLRKLNPDDESEMWSTPMPNVGNDSRLSVAPDDHIWISAPGYGGNGGELWVGRVSP